jgi:hypothetical protein
VPRDFFATIAAGVIGAVVALGIGLTLAPPVTITLGIGMAAAMFFALMASYPRFAGAGALHSLSAAALFVLFGADLPAIYMEDATAALLLFGSFALVLVSIQEAGQLVLRKLFGENADAIFALWRAITSAISLVLTLLAGERIWRKAARYGGIGLGAPFFTLLDILGIQIPAPLFFIDGVSATVIGFVVVITAAAFTLDTIYGAWHLAKTGASAAATGARKGASAASNAAAAGSEYVDEKRDS